MTHVEELATQIPLEDIKGNIKVGCYLFTSHVERRFGRTYVCLYHEGELVRIINYLEWSKAMDGGYPLCSHETHRILEVIPVDDDNGLLLKEPI